MTYEVNISARQCSVLKKSSPRPACLIPVSDSFVIFPPRANPSSLNYTRMASTTGRSWSRYEIYILKKTVLASCCVDPAIEAAETGAQRSFEKEEK